MTHDLDSYESIREWKGRHIFQSLTNTSSLNNFHDMVMRQVFDLAVIRVNKGNPPCEFCWFITGSGGRLEQGLISDQDHGIIFETDNQENFQYFLELGKEISYGLDEVGYPYCKGKVMSSNPLWCKSFIRWKEQLFSGWRKEAGNVFEICRYSMMRGV